MTKPPRQFYSIIVSGPFASGKTTFLKAACSEIGSVMVLRGRCINAGRFALNEKLGIYLFESNRVFFDLQEIPGQLLGAVVIVNNRIPETFREARSIIDTYRAFHLTPITVVANLRPHGTDEPWTEQDFRFALNIDNSIPFIECDVSDSEAVKVVLDTVGQRFLKENHQVTTSTNKWPTQPMLDEVDFFSSDKTHCFMTVVATNGWSRAHEFMELLSDHITWLKLKNHAIPCRWGYSEIDPTMRLHFIPVEQFGTPRDFVGFTFQSLLAMAGEQPDPSPVEEHNLPDNEGTIGHIGLFSSYDKEGIARAKYMVKVFGDDPYVLVDTGRWSLNEPTIHNLEVDEAYLGSPHPIMRVDSGDKDYPRRAICLLNEQLTGIEAEKLRLKFDCLR